MFRKSIFAALALAACISLPARAADIITKAPPLSAGYPTSSGFYYGFGMEGVAASLTNGPAGANVIGGNVTGVVGYTSTMQGGTAFWFVEIIGGWQNLNGGANGFSISGPAHFEQRVGFGGPLNQFIPSLPNISFPSIPSLPGLPNGVTASTSKSYLYAALNEDDISSQFGLLTGRQWSLAPEIGVGMLTRLSNNVVVDSWAGWKMSGQAVCFGSLPGQCPAVGNGAKVGVAFKY